MELPPALKKKVAGLPLGAWLLIIGAGVGIGLYLRRRNQDNATVPEDTGTPVPYQDLPAEDSAYDQYPVTGGGPPSVSGAALRIEGPNTPFRIIVQGARLNKKHRCPAGKHWDTKRKRCVPNRTARAVASPVRRTAYSRGY